MSLGWQDDTLPKPAVDRDSALHTGKDGALSATDANGNGNRGFKAPPALMWDSKGVPEPLGLSAKEKVAAAKSEGGNLPKPPEGAEPAAEPTDGPALGSQVAQMAVHLDTDSLALVPDATLLKQSDRAAFPFEDSPWKRHPTSPPQLTCSQGTASLGSRPAPS